MAYPYQTYPGYYTGQFNAPMQPGYPQQQQPTQQPGPVCRMVSSREEASSTPVDFMGNLMIFPDVQNNRIYTKRWNPQAGATEFGEYVPALRQQGDGQPPADPVLLTLAEMQKKLDEIYKRLGISGETVEGGAEKG